MNFSIALEQAPVVTANQRAQIKKAFEINQKDLDSAISMSGADFGSISGIGHKLIEVCINVQKWIRENHAANDAALSEAVLNDDLHKAEIHAQCVRDGVPCVCGCAMNDPLGSTVVQPPIPMPISPPVVERTNYISKLDILNALSQGVLTDEDIDHLIAVFSKKRGIQPQQELPVVTPQAASTHYVAALKWTDPANPERTKMYYIRSAEGYTCEDYKLAMPMGRDDVEKLCRLAIGKFGGNKRAQYKGIGCSAKFFNSKLVEVVPKSVCFNLRFEDGQFVAQWK